jgi:hypothetical protein
LLEAVAVDITEEGTDHTTLGYPTERGMAAPLLPIRSLQERRHQPEKPLIMPLLSQDREHHRMI